ncbi:hypothetical protein O8B93_27565 [Agrobacterium rhizogenes]|uniref:hypothetical protein n=1 Tax=Rhizobium rhizogenes TaxID=359 RepID=UPI0022B67C6E|nr:hypothetical protein [Rhizobium rhizogenes]MCZ7451324.1 hypothetical protein [Rhizobium rhizogenes]
MRQLILALSVMIGINVPAMAQDIAPVIDPTENARGLHQRSIMGGHAKRARNGHVVRNTGPPKPGTRAFQQQACANRPLYRKQYGASHPEVLKLESLCARAGF